MHEEARGGGEQNEENDGYAPLVQSFSLFFFFSRAVFFVFFFEKNPSARMMMMIGKVDAYSSGAGSCDFDGVLHGLPSTKPSDLNHDFTFTPSVHRGLTSQARPCTRKYLENGTIKGS